MYYYLLLRDKTADFFAQNTPLPKGDEQRVYI